MTTSYASYYEKLAKMPQDLREIALSNWDETGRPVNDNPLARVVVALLKKNPDGFDGFRRDMNLMFDEKPYSQAELVTWYHVFISGIQYVAEKVKETRSVS